MPSATTRTQSRPSRSASTAPPQTTFKSYSSRPTDDYTRGTTPEFEVPPKQHQQQHRAKFTPSRASSTDSHASDDFDFSSLPPNAFGVMHQWELESLEKWQRRLEQLRRAQSYIKSRIESLREDETRMWAECVRSSSTDEEFSTGSSSDSDAAAGSRSQAKSSKKHAKAKPVGEYGEWVGLLYGEIASLQAELAQNKESEEKAKRGIVKATTRLERLRSLEGRWKAPSPSSSPPVSRSTSPSPDHRPKAQRRSSAPASTPSTKSSTKPSSARSTKSESRAPSPASTASTKPTPAAYAKPLQPSTKTASLDPWLAYEDKWHQLSTNPSGAPILLRFSTIPWPMASKPTSPEGITTSEIKEFLLSPRAIRASTKLSEKLKDKTSASSELRTRRALLRAAILRWHPDKFLTKFLGWVEESERAAVKEGVGRVIRCLNEIMRVEDLRARSRTV